MASYGATSSYPPSAPYAQAGYAGPSSYGGTAATSGVYGGGGKGGGGGYASTPYGISSSGGYATSGTLGGSLAPIDWKTQQLAPFRKNFYRESPTIASMSKEEANRVRREREIQIVSGQQGFNPLINFEDSGFSRDTLDRLYAAGFKSPSPIQSQAWPILLSGNDMIGIAETGSGKTLAFLLPAVVHISDQERVRGGEGPVALILAPTRELVEQIKDESQKFALRMRTGVAYGGAPKRQQLQTLRYGCEIVAACPGRLIDFLERGNVSLCRVTYLVLDEADRMLDMGFEPQIRKIVAQIRPDRQTLMFSATWPREVQGLARDLCRDDPVHVTIGTTDLKASHNVEQIVEVVSDVDKRMKALNLLNKLQNEDRNGRVIVFTETKRACDVLTKELRQNGFPALSIHGDKDQEERRYVLEEFKTGRHPIMVATDVASRGLDIKDVKVVINYDMPHQIEDYVHRIGRTGRAGAHGISYSYITPDKGRLARDLIKIMQEAKQKIPRELEDLSASVGGGPRVSRYGPIRGGGRYSGGSYGGGGYGGYGGGRFGSTPYGAPPPTGGYGAYSR